MNGALGLQRLFEQLGCANRIISRDRHGRHADEVLGQVGQRRVGNGPPGERVLDHLPAHPALLEGAPELVGRLHVRATEIRQHDKGSAFQAPAQGLDELGLLGTVHCVLLSSTHERDR